MEKYREGNIVRDQNSKYKNINKKKTKDWFDKDCEDLK